VQEGGQRTSIKRKLTIMSKISNKKKDVAKVQEKTSLDKRGQGTRVFRKTDELYYLMKQIKK
jgi:hypothetical protein